MNEHHLMRGAIDEIETQHLDESKWTEWAIPSTSSPGLPFKGHNDHEDLGVERFGGTLARENVAILHPWRMAPARE